MDIRPTPEKITEWASQVGFIPIKFAEFPPYHFGLVFSKNLKNNQ